MVETPATENEDMRAHWKRSLLVLACAVLVPIIPFALIGELPGEQWLAAQTGGWFTVGVVGAALLALDVLLPIPSSILGALLGGRLGFALGFAFSFAGLSLGSALGYAFGRLWPARLAAPSAASQPTPAFALVLLSRPVPVFAEAISIAAGATRVSIASFALASSLGNALYAAALSANGAALLPAGLAGPGLVLPMLVPVASFLIWRRLSSSRTGRG